MPRIHVTSPFAEEVTTPVGPPPPAPTVAGHAALATALTLTASWVAAAAVVTVRRDELHAWVEGPAATTPAMLLAGLFIGLGGLALLASLVTTGWWLLGLRGVVEWAGAGHLQRRARWWAVAGWVVPIVNLWFPYQVVADASRALGSRVSSFWPWWIAWLLMGLGSVRDTSGGVLADAGDVDGWVMSLQINAVIAVVALVLWWRIVRAATVAAQQAVRVTS
ncbi:DUF4328 domain-containing protein [Janibacter sp. FSL W8-0316]|uniref:DUF4328 domain-containing protein n=1 Tax=Janibacter sp. FSL W8-0316 TaxID=2975325 RepID=UPI0030F8F6E5